MYFCILPVDVLGKLWNIIFFGILKPAKCFLQNFKIKSDVNEVLFFSINAQGAPCAFIEKNSTSLTSDLILKFCKKHLAGFKMPKKIIFQSLPRTSTGKIQKYNLRKILIEDNAKI